MARRLGAAARDRPKSLIELGGRALLDRQLDVLHACGVDDVTCVVGHRSEQIEARPVATIPNPRFETTNMVASLFCARDLLQGDADVVIAYGDIVYEPRVLRSLLETPGEVAVCVDRGWQDLWRTRMVNVLDDAESLRIGPDGRLLELGRKARSVEEIHGQYIGLTRFSAEVLPRVLSIYDGLDASATYEGRDFDNMFMTAFIQLLIDHGLGVFPAWIDHGWVEVDTPADLAAYERMSAEGTLNQLYDPSA